MILAVLVLASSMACGSAKPPAARPTASVASAPEKPVEDPPPAGPPVKVDCGDFTTCAIATGGSVRCWGNDKAGELGGGGGADRGKSVTVPGVEGATSIALASQFACALGSDKKGRCWGTGRLANDGQSRERAKPTEVAGLSKAPCVREVVASAA